MSLHEFRFSILIRFRVKLKFILAYKWVICIERGVESHRRLIKLHLSDWEGLLSEKLVSFTPMTVKCGRMNFKIVFVDSRRGWA